MQRILAGALFLAVAACGPGAPQCTNTAIGGEGCVPATAQANTPLTLQVRPDGCSNACNGTVAYACSAGVTGQTVTLGITENRCTNPPDNNPFTQEACADICEIPSPLDCAVPALAEGDYAVKVQGNPDLTLRVRATGETRCSAPTLP